MASSTKPLFIGVALAFCLPRAAAAQSAPAEADTFSLRITEELRQVDSTAARWFSEADAARDRDDLETAARLYGNVREAHPEFDHATRRLAAVRLQLGQRGEALVLAREAVKRRNRPLNRLLLADVLASGDPTTPTGRSERQEARRMANALVFEPEIQRERVAILGDVAVQVEDWDLLRRCQKRLQETGPELLATAYFTWVVAMMDRDNDAAFAALEAARQRGLPDDAHAELSAITRKARPLHRKILPPAAWIGGIWLAGLLVLLLSGLALSRLTLRAARRLPAVQSGAAIGIDALLRRMYQGILWLTCGYYYVSVPVVLLAVIFLAGAILYGFLAVGHIPIKLALVVVVVALVTLWSGVKSFFVTRRDEDPGDLLSQERNPRLQAVLREVAARIDTRPVDSVYMTPGTEFAVMERGGMLQRLRGSGERCLILGIGVLEGFGLTPFRAVLAHEYGHFSNRDTAGGGFALAVRRSLMQFAVGLAQGGVAAWYNPAWLFFNGFYRIFLRISQGASRLQEVLADRFAAFAYGSRAFERGLRHVIDRSVRFDAYANASIQQVLRTKEPLTNLYAFAPQHPPEEAQIERAIEAAIHAEPSPYDSHPAPADRIAWVHALDAPEHEESREAAWSLFSDRANLEKRMTEWVRHRLRQIHGAELAETAAGDVS